MSSIFSQELAASASGSSEPECEPSRSARSNHSSVPSSPSIGLASPSMMMSESSPGPSYEQPELPWMSSVADFPAKTSASPAPSWASMASDRDSGRRLLDWFASFDHATSSWRTSQTCLISGLEEFSETWPRSGMMQSGSAYRRLTLAPGIGGTEFGWLPTPTKTADSKGAPKNRYYGSPTCRSNLREWLRDGPDDPIYPHPDFVERVMGYPIGWTELAPSEIRLSPKSRKSSDERS